MQTMPYRIVGNAQLPTAKKKKKNIGGQRPTYATAANPHLPVALSWLERLLAGSAVVLH